jgi:hypothetical protein
MNSPSAVPESGRRGRQKVGSAAWKIHHVQTVHRAENHPLSIGRQRRPPDETRAHGGAILDTDRCVDARRDLGGDIHRHRNHPRLAGREIDALQLAADRHDQ